MFTLKNSGIVTRSRIVLLENDYLTISQIVFLFKLWQQIVLILNFSLTRVLQGSVSLEDPASVLLMEGFAKKLFGKMKPYWQDSHLFEWKGD